MIDFNQTNTDDIEIDEKKIIAMVNRIYNIERINAKTAIKTDKVMKDEIKKIIEEEVKKCY